MTSNKKTQTSRPAGRSAPRSTPRNASRPKLVVRNATPKDMTAIRALTAKVYAALGSAGAYSMAQLRGHQHHFPEGQFVAVYEDAIVGYCATFRIGGNVALKPHDWVGITGRGYAARHDPEGDHLYGMEICVDPDYRGLRIGQRLYNARKQLCQHLRLKGIVFGGRMPGLSRRWNQVRTPDRYVELARNGELRDQVISFQLRNGFEPIGVLPDYLTSDHESRGFATHMLWRNPQVGEEDHVAASPRLRPQSSVRVACVQYQQRAISSFADFARQVEYFVDSVADYKADFVLFPELFTLQLLSIENKPAPAAEAIAALTSYTDRIRSLLSELAVSYNINIIGGSHPTRDADGHVYNICYVCLRDGAVHEQRKIHPTPNERYWWNITGGDTMNAIETDCGPIGVMICYDAEFPELARHLTDQGAQILFVPFCTDERQSYLRVRYCGQARAVENQCYVALAGNVGNLPNVENMDIQYAQSCVLTPCDFPFARDGIAADTTPNVEMVSIADLQLDSLANARQGGTVQNLKDRRFDLYSVTWKDSLPT
ncbi:GNAT family N-acetyltransferase [Ferrovibrio sp.]|uniref:GNAT family N-acetyltransferase n=1 Tax=Ferrovibrio sp. TaxID=1917215 RepID=UPI00311E64C6